MRTAKEQREIRFIYNKHNKSTKYKLEIDDNRIVFPENIRLIINKREKRTNEEAEELKCFREKVLSEMAEESAQIEKTVEMELLKKKRDRIERIRIAQDKRNQNDSSKKKHIGIWITLGSKSRISREHYAEINKKSSLCKEYFEMKKSCCGFASLMIFVCTVIIITVGYSGEKSG